MIGDLFKEATGYDVEVVAGNGAETMSRIEAEKSNPQWDVVWIDSMYDVYNLSGDGSLLTGWEPENAANLTEFSKGLVPDNKCCWPTDIHAAGVLVYRTDKYDQSSAPRTFADLTDEAYAGQVGMADNFECDCACVLLLRLKNKVPGITAGNLVPTDFLMFTNED